MKYESSYYIWRTKGAVEEKEKSEAYQTNKNFEEKGIETFKDKLLKYEVDLLFFPSQPLVTPELLEKINNEARAINDLDQKFNKIMSGFDSYFCFRRVV